MRPGIAHVVEAIAVLIARLIEMWIDMARLRAAIIRALDAPAGARVEARRGVSATASRVP